MNNVRRILVFLISAFCVTFSASAQDFTDTKAFGEKKAEEEGGDKRTSGHRYNISLGGNIVDNKNVVGQSDGKTSIYSLSSSYKNEKINQSSEWISNVSLNESVTKTPDYDRFVKTDDVFKVDSTYKQFFSSIDWLGSFVRLDLETALMDGYDDRGATTSYLITYTDKPAETVTKDRLLLSDAFKPLTTKQSAGAVAQFVDSVAATGEFRLGLGAKQIQAEGQFLVKDDEDTPEIDVIELENVSLLGLQTAVEVGGAAFEKSLDYSVFAEALYPLQYSPKNDGDPSESELVSTEVGLKLAYNFSSWLSANYKFSSKRDPLLTDKAQVAHSFTFAANYNYDSRK